METNRADYLRLLRKAARVGGPLWDAQRLCLCLLHGLPVGEAVSIGFRALGRYAPIFRAHWPGTEETIATRGLMIAWELDSRVMEEDADVLTKRVAMERESLFYGDHYFLEAVREAVAVARGAAPSEVAVAEAVHRAVCLCIYQRVLNVWAADEPLAAGMDLLGDELLQRLFKEMPISEERVYAAESEAAQDYLRGRGLGDSEVAAAVARREWRAVAGWFEGPVRRHPQIDGEALEKVLESFVPMYGI